MSAIINDRPATNLCTADFYYDLPEERIAQHPVEPRDHSRLMVVRRDSHTVEHKHFYDIVDELREGDVLVVNESKVIPSRLYGTVEGREDAMIDDVLSDMRQHKHHIAIVVDENKKMLGLATIEDFLEELVGEIFDEEDVVDRNFQSLGGNKYLINTHMLLGNAYERMGLGSAPRAIAAKPILAFMLETLGHLPVEEETFLYGDLEFTAEKVEGDRVTEVMIHILDEDDLAARRAAAESEVEA
jgi:CBS domain containing-hemolysin-like protein